MKLRHPALISLAAFLLAAILRIWMRCVRVRVANFDADDHCADPRQRRFVYAFWHEDILFAAIQRAKIRVLISQHADGELIAQTAHHLGKGAVRGSSTRGGTGAILEMVRGTEGAHLGVTPDGPRGPRRRVQMGVVFLASQTGLPLVGFGVGYTRAGRAKSWDRFAIPWPGSAACAVVAPAVVVPRKLNRAQLEEYRQLIEDRLTWASEEAERWATTGRRPTQGPALTRQWKAHAK
ncbi:MAG: lysophospholipid acyltransferase family protein [Gemmataceae bacterium]